MGKQAESNSAAMFIAECRGRRKALKALNSVKFDFGEAYIIKHTSPICKWDFEIVARKTKKVLAYIEAKDRNYNSQSHIIKTEGAQLDFLKYDLLCALSEYKQTPVFYLSTFSDGRFYLWDVLKCNISRDTRMCNKTTAFASGKVKKDCVYFQLDDAQYSGEF